MNEIIDEETLDVFWYRINNVRNRRNSMICKGSRYLALTAVIFMLLACTENNVGDTNVDDFTIRSTAFSNGGAIPRQYTRNISPPFSWEGVPEGTVSFMMNMVDVTVGGLRHWLLWNIPASITNLEEGFSTNIRFGRQPHAYAYIGPAPPFGSTHTYQFTLYALDTTLSFADPDNITEAVLFQAMTNHILAQSNYTGTYTGRRW